MTSSTTSRHPESVDRVDLEQDLLEVVERRLAALGGELDRLRATRDCLIAHIEQREAPRDDLAA